MTSNRTSLAQVRQMSAKEVSELPTSHLALLLEDHAENKAEMKKLDDKFSDALNIKFGETAAKHRKAGGKDTGRVSFEHDDHIVRADAPKKVTWDQEKLAAAILTLVNDWKESPSDYVTNEIKISETKYNAWPPSIRKLFAPSRIVATGKPSYVIERPDA